MTRRVLGFKPEGFPFGILIEISGGSIISVKFTERPEVVEPETRFEKKVIGVFEDYFSGKRVNPSILPANPEGTPFQKKIWNIVKSIPYGTTMSYGEVAEKAGMKKGARAVGVAMKTNPAPIVIPCHRVVGRGWIGGYSPGIQIKRILLKLEGVSMD